MLKLVSILIAAVLAFPAFAGTCESDYKTSNTDDFAYVYTNATTLKECLAKSKEFEQEAFIFKTLDNGKVIAIVFIDKGEIRSTIPQ